MCKINNPLVPQLAEKYRPVKKIGKWTILQKKTEYMVNPNNCICVLVTDDFCAYDGIMCRGDEVFRWDFPERIPKGVRDWLNNSIPQSFRFERKEYA